MAGTTAAPTTLESLWEYARIRSFLFVFVPVLILFALQTLFEYPPASHAVDDLLIVVATVLGIVVLLRARRSGTAVPLARANRVALAVSAVVALAGVLAVAVEYGDVMDLGDDPLTIIGGVLALVNGLVLFSGAGGAPAAQYRDEWLRVRTGLWFYPMFVFVGLGFANVFGGGTPFGGLGILGYLYVAVLVAGGIAGIALLVRARSETEPARLHSANNALAAIVIVLIVLSVLNFDILTLALMVALLVNRFV